MKTKLMNAHHVNYSVLKSNLTEDLRSKIDGVAAKLGSDVYVSENADYVTISMSFNEDVDAVEVEIQDLLDAGKVEIEYI